MNIIQVTWIDPAFSQAGWQSDEDVAEWIGGGVPISHSVGFLIYEDDSMIILAQSLGENSIAADLIKITRTAVQKIKVLSRSAVSKKNFPAVENLKVKK